MLLGHYSEIRLVQGTELSPFLPKYSLFLSSIPLSYLLPFFLHVPFQFILFFPSLLLSFFYSIPLTSIFSLSFFPSFSLPSISSLFFSFLPSFLLFFPSLPFSLPAKDFISCIYLMQDSNNSLMSFLCR